MLPPPGFEPSVRAEAACCSPLCGPRVERRDHRGSPKATAGESGRVSLSRPRAPPMIAELPRRLRALIGATPPDWWQQVTPSATFSDGRAGLGETLSLGRGR